MPWSIDPQPSAERLHTIGFTAFLAMLGLYAAAGLHAGTTGRDTTLNWVLGAAAVLAAFVALIGRLRGWQGRRGLLVGWPVASLVVTLLAGAVEPAATRDLPGTITITFAYLGLTGRRWRSLALLPLGAAAFVVACAKPLPSSTLTVVLAAIMWVLVAEVPAWLIARLVQQSLLLRDIAQTDPLTQLLNRSTLGDRLAHHAGRCAVVLADLDNFKRYNDRHGHEAGDEVLVAFADALRRSARKDDIIFRIGGDEFLLMLVGADPPEAGRILERLRRRWAEAGAPVDFSAGIAAGEHDVMRLADEGMYADKRARGLAGRDSINGDPTALA
ncbi:GGDEF domain-containing protein [Mycobacterium paraffinicum]|uniref:GGDEF domain-containing protein n=1 Tax=Mycobacterium paraffinicum TaxID=53378 RepID=A0A1Q4HZ75_9MYCO|nr:GGDEF domain-containing protein [Mycobacterium paraffinicum]OJZ74940.1 GGDEF domain-containing protein [Mycobacterium paraffinicum]